MPSTYSTPALLRGCVVGATTGTLAIAAHGMAGGGYPTTTGAALLLITALVTGAVAGSAARWGASGRDTLISLAAGQAAGHWALTGLTAHHDTAGDATTDSLPASVMLTAHLAAVAVCALVIAVAERLYRSASAAVRALLRPPRSTPGTPGGRVTATTRVAADRSPNGASGPRAPPVRTDPVALAFLGEKASNTCPTGSPPAYAGV